MSDPEVHIGIVFATPSPTKAYRLHLFVGDDIDCDELPKSDEIDYRNVRAITATTTTGPSAFGGIAKVAGSSPAGR